MRGRLAEGDRSQEKIHVRKWPCPNSAGVRYQNRLSAYNVRGGKLKTPPEFRAPSGLE